MNGFIYTSLFLLLIAPSTTWAAGNYYLLPGAGVVNLHAVPDADNKTDSLQALSLRGGYAVNRYISAETDLLIASSKDSEFSSIALFAAHRLSLTNSLFVKSRLGWTFNRLHTNDKLPTASGNGISAGLALGWKLNRFDLELDYTAMERDIDSLMLHIALFK